jgi:putative ABC transport system permease protein
VLATAGTLAALFLAYAGVRLLLYLGASELPRLQSVPFDLRVLAFALAALAATTLLIGLAPALRLARIDIRTLLNDSGRAATTGRVTHRIFSTMIVGEIIVAIMLVGRRGLARAELCESVRDQSGIFNRRPAGVRCLPSDRPLSRL